MSHEGINKFAAIMSDMQQTRGELIRMASKKPGTPNKPGSLATKSGQQDLLLGQLLEDMKDHVKDRFMEILQMDIN